MLMMQSVRGSDGRAVCVCGLSERDGVVMGGVWLLRQGLGKTLSQNSSTYRRTAGGGELF